MFNYNEWREESNIKISSWKRTFFELKQISESNIQIFNTNILEKNLKTKKQAAKLKDANAQIEKLNYV